MGSGVLLGAHQEILSPPRPAAAIRHPRFLPPSAERPGESGQERSRRALPSWAASGRAPRSRHVPLGASATPFPSLGRAAPRTPP